MFQNLEILHWTACELNMAAAEKDLRKEILSALQSIYRLRQGMVSNFQICRWICQPQSAQLFTILLCNI